MTRARRTLDPTWDKGSGAAGSTDVLDVDGDTGNLSDQLQLGLDKKLAAPVLSREFAVKQRLQHEQDEKDMRDIAAV